MAAADPHWARRLHRDPGAPAFPPEARPWAGASTLAQPQPLSVLSSPAGRQHAAGPQPCIQRRSRCHQGRGHHWPFRSPFRAHAVVVCTYDWLPVNTAVREFPHTFLNAMDHPGSSR